MSRRRKPWPLAVCVYVAGLLASTSLWGQVRREFYDPNLGSYWRLVMDLQHPARPGRLVLLEKAPLALPAAQEGEPHPAPGGVSNLALPVVPPISIRAGDRVTVDQETPTLHARLQAVALESGGVGQRIRVRLTTGAETQQGVLGKVIVAIATGAREARWLNAEGSRP